MRSDLDRFFLLTISYQFDAVNIHIKFILFNFFVFFLNNNLFNQIIKSKKEHLTDIQRNQDLKHELFFVHLYLKIQKK